MFVLIGLGNPGAQYALNRHNIGFMTIDVIAESYNFPPFKNKFNALISEGMIGETKVILCKPLTFMNLSGKSAQTLLQFYKISLEKVYVIHDDLDVLPGKIKLKLGGGNGGHNGLSSLDQHIGKDYWRLRLGIGHPGHRDAVTNYVLGNFSKQDHEWLADILSTVTREVPALFTLNSADWLSKVNSRTN